MCAEGTWISPGPSQVAYYVGCLETHHLAVHMSATCVLCIGDEVQTRNSGCAVAGVKTKKGGFKTWVSHVVGGAFVRVRVAT